jgi:hypothetical protein
VFHLAPEGFVIGDETVAVGVERIDESRLMGRHVKPATDAVIFGARFVRRGAAVFALYEQVGFAHLSSSSARMAARGLLRRWLSLCSDHVAQRQLPGS